MGRAGDAALPKLESSYSAKSFHFFLSVFLMPRFSSSQSDEVKVLPV